jgi:hypothetical protein
MNFELAPAAVIRAAAWPVETLEVFGNPGLAEACRKKQSVDSAYEETVGRERASLWERTVGDRHFMKALLLASPSLFERVRTHQGSLRPRTKSVRHLETALYRYLARASARSTPNQLWAGVTLARFGDEERIVAAAPRAHFSPELAPFVAALSSLGKRPVYRQAASWRLPPTLRRQQGGTWRFLARPLSGGIQVGSIGSDAAIDSCFERLANAGTGTLRELSLRADVPSNFLETLAQGGGLVGGLSFPTRFASPWEGLALAAEALIGADRSAWQRARSLLATLGDRLENDFDQLSADAMVEIMAQARAVLAELFAALDVQVDAPQVPLRCDLSLPFDVTLGPETRYRLQDNLRVYQSEWIDQLSPESEARRQRRNAVVEALASAPVRLGDEVPKIAPREIPKTNDSMFSAPWGSFVTQFGNSGVARVIGIDDSPIRLFARHSSLFGSGNDAELWVRSLFSRLEADCGVRAADLSVPFERNPNVLSRPGVARLLVEPWGASGIDLHEAELRVEGGAILLYTPSEGWITAVSCSPANVLGEDPLAAAIALTGFDEPMGGHFQASSQPTLGERESVHYAKRLVLSTGATIRPRRTYLGGKPLEELTRLSGKARYLHWCGLADRLGWPERVALSAGGEPPLVLPTSSPLAVEAALQGAWRSQHILVEEADPSDWLAGPHGNHVAEIVVPFSRTPHAFTGRKKAE